LIEAAKSVIKKHWPRLRLRTILLGTLLFVAGLPGISAVFLRVYENTLVRQTETELITQGAALAAAAGNRFVDGGANRNAENFFRPEPPDIDLNSAKSLPERPEPRFTKVLASPASLKMGEAFEPILVQTGRTTLASIILLDQQGVILTGLWKGMSYAHIPEVRAAMEGKAITVLRRNGSYQARYSFEWLSRAAALRVHHIRPVIVDGKVAGVLVLSRSSRALFRGMYQDRGKIAVGAALIFLTLLILTLLLHRSIAKPIEALSRATRNVADGRGDIPEAPPTAAIEIRALYEDFREMSAAITRRSRYLRDFAAAVSHEFKTPLAGIRGGIELIEDHHGTMSAKERKQFLGNISADANRLSHLVSRLLDLARADMAQPESGIACDVAALLRKLVDATSVPGFEAEAHIPTRAMMTSVPEAALETIILGLIENSRQAGAKRVSVILSDDHYRLTLALIDDGTGIAPSDKDRLFEPFFTTKRADGGTGLGLPIARSLIEAHQGLIDLILVEEGAQFLLTMPRVNTPQSS
jgi:signal transduction histidine kinase